MDHWAFKPVKDSPAPAVKSTSWPRTEVDRFVLAELEKNGLAPVANAEPAALFRRVHLDLTGLPPTAEEVAGFLREISEDNETVRQSDKEKAISLSPPLLVSSSSPKVRSSIESSIDSSAFFIMGRNGSQYCSDSQ